MGLSLNTNLNALAAQRSTGRSQNELSTAIARLSSGLRINSARDDAAGMAIADRFTAQIRGTNQASRNANDAISLSQTAESALGSVSEALQRIRELAVQSANATNSASDRAALQQEVAQLVQEVDRVSTQTQFNGISLLDGSFTAKAFQVGASAGQTINVAQIASARSAALGQRNGFEVVNQSIGTGFSNVFPLFMDVSGNNMYLGNLAVDAKAIATAINASNTEGLSATANSTFVSEGVSTALASSSGTAIFTVNGVAISLTGATGGAALSANRASATAAINAHSGTTGVVATDTGSGIQLLATDGRNISTNYNFNTFTGSMPADFGLGATGGTVGTTINLSYDAPPGLSGSIVFTQSTGLNASFAIGPAGVTLAALDVATQAGASAALKTADAALASVSASRATLGAVQNRFASTVANLQQTGENLAAARSRIRDADFAMETASLTRTQVLQQAGTAMVAQANQLPQQVLALLR